MAGSGGKQTVCRKVGRKSTSFGNRRTRFSLVIRVAIFYLSVSCLAQVAKLADALGSGPSGINLPCRFKSCPGHFRDAGIAKCRRFLLRKGDFGLNFRLSALVRSLEIRQPPPACDRTPRIRAPRHSIERNASSNPRALRPLLPLCLLKGPMSRSGMLPDRKSKGGPTVKQTVILTVTPPS